MKNFSLKIYGVTVELRYCAYMMICVGTFRVSSVYALVLFDSGASRSFVSIVFSRHISNRR